MKIIKIITLTGRKVLQFRDHQGEKFLGFNRLTGPSSIWNFYKENTIRYHYYINDMICDEKDYWKIINDKN